MDFQAILPYNKLATHREGGGGGGEVEGEMPGRPLFPGHSLEIKE